MKTYVYRKGINNIFLAGHVRGGIFTKERTFFSEIEAAEYISYLNSTSFPTIDHWKGGFPVYKCSHCGYAYLDPLSDTVCNNCKRVIKWSFDNDIDKKGDKNHDNL